MRLLHVKADYSRIKQRHLRDLVRRKLSFLRSAVLFVSYYYCLSHRPHSHLPLTNSKQLITAETDNSSPLVNMKLTTVSTKSYYSKLPYIRSLPSTLSHQTPLILSEQSQLFTLFSSQLCRHFLDFTSSCRAIHILSILLYVLLSRRDKRFHAHTQINIRLISI